MSNLFHNESYMLHSFQGHNNNNSSSSALEQLTSVFDTDSSIPLEESSPQNNGLMTTFKGASFPSIPYNQIGKKECTYTIFS